LWKAFPPRKCANAVQIMTIELATHERIAIASHATWELGSRRKEQGQ